MTPNELIAKVMDTQSRQDYETELLAQFPTALRSAHGVNDWRRDQKTISVFDPLIADGNCTIPIVTDLPKLRKISGIRIYSSYTTVGLINTVGTEIPSTFKNILDSGQFDYYGIPFQQTYSIFGSILNLNGIDASTTAVSVSGLFYPTFEVNSLSGEYETDSWIMIEFPEMVEAYLDLWVARKSKDAASIQSYGQALAMARQQLITSFEQELL
jgi:hypothetical protein